MSFVLINSWTPSLLYLKYTTKILEIQKGGFILDLKGMIKILLPSRHKTN